LSKLFPFGASNNTAMNKATASDSSTYFLPYWTGSHTMKSIVFKKFLLLQDDLMDIHTLLKNTKG
jgi:hypothetical protein